MDSSIININEPCIQDIIITKDEVDVCYTTKDGQDETKLFMKEDESVMYTVNIGDVSGIGFGGTDNWGKDRLPLYLKYPKGSENYDGVYVDDITIQEYAGDGNWCKCELINNNSAVHYIALSENTSKDPRTAYFYHSTKDKTVKMGYNEGRPAAPTWCVTVIQNGNPNAEPVPVPTPQPQPKDLGKYLYKVGLISDLHISKSSNEWWDEDDFKAAMEIFKNDTEVKFIASCGDISESSTNAYQKHPEAVCDVDYAELKEMYDVPYWQVAGLRFFSPLGNHDFYGLFESRYGDVITGKKNSECISGYNDSVIHRIADLWPTGQQINGIVPGRGRIIFELEKGKSTPVGQADMKFFSYNDYVDLYCRQGGYTGTSIWDANKGGISDEAIKCAKQYVNSNWSSVKDSLVMWNNGGGHGRNGYSKLNYWLKKDDDIFIFLTLDYGNDVWPVNDIWHDRMVHARTIINTKEDDPYIKRMMEYVADTSYSKADEAYNYQYYSPNTLIWLKELLENNKDKKVYLFTHHFMTNRSGNGAGVPKDGNWYYSVISPDGVKDSRESGIYNKGSNALTGVEYWFFEKLLREYRNLIMFTGHSHISFSSGINFDNHTYDIVSPSEKNEFVYTKASEKPVADSAMCVAMPSLSKPRDIVNGQSVRRYNDAEMAMMEVYENGVRIKGYKIKKDNVKVYDPDKPLVDKTIILK